MSAPNRAVVVPSSLNLDVSICLDVAPAGGETVLANTVTQSLGGKGANTAIAAARASNGACITQLAAVCGSDDAATSLKAELVQAGVDVTLMRHDDRYRTGCAYIVVEANGENRIIVDAGANAHFGQCLFGAALWNALDNAVVVLHMEIPPDDVIAIAAEARKRGATVLLNASPVDGVSDPLLKLVDVVVVNEIEVTQIAGVSDAKEAAKRLVGMSTNATVVVTQGKNDVLVATKQGIEVVKSVRARSVVDTTGAGDTLTGYLAAGLGRGMRVNDALEIAVVASSITVENVGASVAIPTLSAVEARRDELKLSTQA